MDLGVGGDMPGDGPVGWAAVWLARRGVVSFVSSAERGLEPLAGAVEDMVCDCCVLAVSLTILTAVINNEGRM